MAAKKKAKEGVEKESKVTIKEFAPTIGLKFIMPRKTYTNESGYRETIGGEYSVSVSEDVVKFEGACGDEEVFHREYFKAMITKLHSVLK